MQSERKLLPYVGCRRKLWKLREKGQSSWSFFFFFIHPPVPGPGRMDHPVERSINTGLAALAIDSLIVFPVNIMLFHDAPWAGLDWAGLAHH